MPPRALLPRWKGPLLAACWLTLAPPPAQAGELHVVVRDADGAALADAVVVAARTAGPQPGSGARPGQATLDQVNKEFQPHVVAVAAGTPVHFPNHDNVRHHVYSFSAAKTFELPLYIGQPAAPVVFDRPGVVTLGCNIHDWMVGYVYVADSPYFAKTAADGTATLGSLPAGDYLARVWHPRLVGSEQATARPVSVPRNGAAAADWTLALKPEFRFRRAPLPNQRGYR